MSRDSPSKAEWDDIQAGRCADDEREFHQSGHASAPGRIFRLEGWRAYKFVPLAGFTIRQTYRYDWNPDAPQSFEDFKREKEYEFFDWVI